MRSSDKDYYMPKCRWRLEFYTYGGLCSHLSINEGYTYDEPEELLSCDEINQAALEHKKAKQSQYVANKGEGVPGNDVQGLLQPSNSATDAAARAFAPSQDFQGAHTTYQYFLQGDDSAGWNETAKLQQCLEQCHGFGGPCAGVAWGHNVQGQAYGAQVSGVACLFLGQAVAQSDLVGVTNGSWTQAVAVNIEC